MLKAYFHVIHMSMRLPFPTPADGWHCQLSGAMSIWSPSGAFRQPRRALSARPRTLTNRKYGGCCRLNLVFSSQQPAIVLPDLRAKRNRTAAPTSLLPGSYLESCPWLTPSSRANPAWLTSNPRISRMRRPTAFQSISTFVEVGICTSTWWGSAESSRSATRF